MALYEVKHLVREGSCEKTTIYAANHREAFREAQKQFDDVLSVRRARSPWGKILLYLVGIAAIVAFVVWARS